MLLSLILTVLAQVAAPAVEIDLSPLPGMGKNVEYSLRLTFGCADGSRFDQDYKIGANTDPTDVAEFLLETLPDKLQAKIDGPKLIVTSFNDKPITKVEIAALGLPQGANPPKVRRLPKEEPDEKKPEKK